MKNTKTCKSCQTEQPLSNYEPHDTCEDGYKVHCKRCAYQLKGLGRRKEWALAGYYSPTEYNNAILEHLSQFIPDFVEDKEAARQRILAQIKKPKEY